MKPFALSDRQRSDAKRGEKSGKRGGVTCPKCRTTRGLYRYETVTHGRIMPRGISCFVCGYWIEIVE